MHFCKPGKYCTKTTIGTIPKRMELKVKVRDHKKSVRLRHKLLAKTAHPHRLILYYKQNVKKNIWLTTT